MKGSKGVAAAVSTGCGDSDLPCHIAGGGAHSRGGFLGCRDMNWGNELLPLALWGLISPILYLQYPIFGFVGFVLLIAACALRGEPLRRGGCWLMAPRGARRLTDRSVRRPNVRVWHYHGKGLPRWKYPPDGPSAGRVASAALVLPPSLSSMGAWSPPISSSPSQDAPS